LSRKRADSDEHYVLNLCDALMGMKCQRQEPLPFLFGDKSEKTGKVRMLPVDGLYRDRKLVIEYHERQHTESVPFFDRKLTVSGMTRGEQRRIYDQRRRDKLPENGYRLVEIRLADLEPNGRRKLTRDSDRHSEVIRRMLVDAGVELPQVIILAP